VTPARAGNPRTGEPVKVPAKAVPFFKAGKELRARVNGGEDPEADRLTSGRLPRPLNQLDPLFE